MDEFSQAVQIALNPGSDPQLKLQATEYLEVIKNSPDGWEHALERLFTEGTEAASPQVKFVCLQIIDNVILHRYASLTQEQRVRLRTRMHAFYTDWIPNHEEEAFIKAKYATLYARLIGVEYPESWPSVFLDLLAALGVGVSVVDMFLRILDAVHEEIISMEVPRTTEMRAVATLVKDSLREQCISQIADAWYTILTTYATSHPHLVVAALKNLGMYVSWMDINLVACDRFVHVFYQFLQVAQYQEGVCEVLMQMVNKGAEAEEKVVLIRNLHLLEVIKGIDSSDEDFQTSLAKLLRATVLVLLTAQQDLRTKEGADPTPATQALDEAVSITLTYTCKEDDGVSEETLPAINAYTARLAKDMKVNGNITPIRQQHIAQITQILFTKFKYDPEFNFDAKNDEELDFLEYRKSLANILKLVCRVDPTSVQNFAAQAVQAMVPNVTQMQFFDVEAVLYFIFVLGEAFRKLDESIFQVMISRLVTSNVAAFPHRAVSIMFLEVLQRFSRLATATDELLKATLGIFLDERGIRHPHATVRARACYLFLRTVKAGKSKFAVHTDTIVTSFADMLHIAVPGHTPESVLHFDDQASLFEVIGSLVGASQAGEQQFQWLQAIFGPLEAQITEILSNQWYKSDSEQNPAVATALSHLISAQAYVAKGLGGAPAHEASMQLLNKTLRACFACAHALPDVQVVMSKVTFYLHAMITCMDDLFLTQAPLVFESLLKVHRLTVLTDFMRLVCQMITKYKEKVTDLVKTNLLHVIQHVLEVINKGKPTDEDMLDTEQNELKRQYYQFLQYLIAPTCAHVFTDPVNVGNLNQILNTVMEGTTDSDRHIQATAFGILTRSVDLWAVHIPGFDQFILQAILPACFSVPLAPDFNLKDPSDGQVLGETANCLRAIQGRVGDDFGRYLSSTYLPSMQVPPELAQAYVTQMHNSNVSFRKFLLDVFYVEFKAAGKPGGS
eukprot:TRINITY_DN6127_c0_g1_i7.p1 TRINITY_DN6127_c0_g1~~TRINITY_DN6127_c0_g1_i7.p1  ORF type:complete len:958 (-),score=191.80 TRINITY_DN6127_c0_g1_i7:233-3106(-)